MNMLFQHMILLEILLHSTTLSWTLSPRTFTSLEILSHSTTLSRTLSPRTSSSLELQ